MTNMPKISPGVSVMKAFVIAGETVKDDAMFAGYRAAVTATVEPLGNLVIVDGAA